MILVDANVLVAIVDEGDRLHGIAARDLKGLKTKALGLTSVVLSEALFLLPDAYLRQRIQYLLEELRMTPVELEPPWWDQVFAWLSRYQEHEPDLADAQLAVLSGRDTNNRVWTYDSEFRTIWRRPDGTRIPLVGGAKR